MESSWVHLVLPEKSLFVEDEEPARASVIIKLRRGKWLNKEQVRGIVHLVSASVSRLKPEDVTVVDQSGKMLAGFSDGSLLHKLTSDQMEYQKNYELNLENRVKTMLEKALGRDKAIVRLSCALDFKQREMTEERYFPENRVVRSEQVLLEKSGEAVTSPTGVPGLRSNISKELSTAKNSGKNEFEKEDRTVNYEIGKQTSHVIEPTATLKKISVAVIVDGTYQRVEKRNGAVEWNYIPRTPQEMEMLESIVMSAVNFDETRGDKVEVANLAFQSEKLQSSEEQKPEITWRDRIAEFAAPLRYAFLGLFLLFSFLFIVRPIIGWLTAGALGDVEILRQLPKTVGEIEREYGGNQMPFRDELNHLLATENEVSVDVAKKWLNEAKSA